MMMKNNFPLLIGTKNSGKIKELERLLADLPFDLRSLNDFANVIEPEETGTTYVENACLKATYYARQTKLWALADDSGLEIEALGGAPGVYSARYGGKQATDGERINKLLKEMSEANNKSRRARFVCVMAVAAESGEIRFTAEGVCDGQIALKASGTGGFGYDPIFIPDGYATTFGELSEDIKQRISHRAQTVFKIIEYLRGFNAALS